MRRTKRPPEAPRLSETYYYDRRPFHVRRRHRWLRGGAHWSLHLVFWLALLAALWALFDFTGNDPVGLIRGLL